MFAVCTSTRKCSDFHQVCDLESAMEDKMMKLMMTSTELDDEKRKNEDLQVVATIVFLNFTDAMSVGMVNICQMYYQSNLT